MESMVIITRIMTRHGIIMPLSGYVAEMQEEKTTRIAACVGKEDFLFQTRFKRNLIPNLRSGPILAVLIHSL